MALSAEGKSATRRMGMLVQLNRFDFSGHDFVDRVRVYRSLVKVYERTLDPGDCYDPKVQMAAMVSGAPKLLLTEILGAALGKMQGSAWPSSRKA